MRDYSKGKIYHIVCNITGDTYYGSTVQKISQRMNCHRNKVSKCLSKPIIERGDYHYGLVEDYKCDNLEQLLMRERYYIDNNNCVNKNSPIRTKEEKIAYYEEHKEEIAAKNKAYYEEHKEEHAATMKVYYEEHKEEKSARDKVYQQEHKEEIAAKKKVWAEEHKEELAAKAKVYYEANKEKISAQRKAKQLLKKQTEK